MSCLVTRPLIPARRRQEILRAVRAGSTHVGELAQTFGVSEMTVRRDLRELAGAGMVERVRGGAVRAGGDLEVVDLLQLGLVLTGLVVLVGGIGGPVAARGEDLDHDHLVGRERRRGADVVDLAAGLAGPPQLDRDLPGRPVGRVQASAGPGRG